MYPLARFPGKGIETTYKTLGRFEAGMTDSMESNTNSTG
jgi:hypothetical protein